MSWTRHTVCRSCRYAEPSGPPGIKAVPSGEKLIPVFSLGNQPLANAFANQDEPQSAFYPLEVLYCPRCGLAQLSATVPADVLYKTYAYTTSKSDTMLEHFAKLWRSIRDRNLNCENVLEIGSNDGYLLDYVRKNGAESVVGIDPAENLAAEANNKGVRTFCGVFDEATANVASLAMPSVDVVIARHVFCHVDDWHGFIATLDKVCQKNTLVAIEVPYVMDLLRHTQFDTIYHEHLSYLNIKALQALLEHSVFRIDHVQHFDVHGGAIVIYLRRRDYEGAADESVEWYLNHEKDNLNVAAWQEFDRVAHLNLVALQKTVNDLLNDGKTVAGFGASAKSTVWMNACGFTSKQVRFITDTTPQKQWKYCPGTDVKIVDEGALLRELPDYAILYAWNFMSECLKKNNLYLSKGGKFIVPVPTVRIIEQTVV